MSFRVSLLVVVLIQCIAWTTAALTSSTAMLALCGMAYVLGLRHALDADHIAAIDNVSRSLLGRGEHATGVGLFFALGHSTVVTGASFAVGVAAIRMSAAFEQARAIAAVYSTLISVTVLIAIAPRNAWAAWRIYRGEEGTMTFASRGLLSRVVRPILGFQLKSWQMFFVGALFGLGFETATAVALLGLSAAQASGGVSLASAMVFPLLFTAGMTLVDALDGIFMERAYGWALQEPRRHAGYNLAVTSLSVLVATLVGGFELASLAHHAWGGVLPGAAMLEFVENHFEEIGAGIIIVFVAGWIIATVKERRDDKRLRGASSRQPGMGGLPIEAAE